MAYPEETDEMAPRVTKETQVLDTRSFLPFFYPFTHSLAPAVLLHLPTEPSPANASCRQFSKTCSMPLF